MYRGVPFWAWNGRLDPTELRRQIRVMHEMGLGGFFMHSRVGLDTAYLSEEWFECINACVDEATKLNMNAWLYDEDRWPSGTAGGLVTKNPKYGSRGIAVQKIRNPRALRWTKNILAAFTATIHGTSVCDVKRLPRGRKPNRLCKNGLILAFSVEVRESSSWYNGYSYLDTLSHEAVGRFIEVTHEAYRREAGGAFGKTIRGIFTDEPNYEVPAIMNGHAALPWTDKLPSVFKKRYGYDILNHLPELFYNIDGKSVTPARFHYYDCITFLFCDAFVRQISDWCEKNGITHTGHALLEQDLQGQTRTTGSCMRFYESMHAPAMDLLTEYSREYDTAKQVTSAARQFGRRWRLTETYGCTGWDFDFCGHKALGDWQVALGLNVRCQHLSWYTMEGEAKRDYPAGIFYQSPWWRNYSKVEDYFARINVTMSQGMELRDLLVIHPIESMWVSSGVDGSDRRKALDDMFWRMRDTLLAANLDFDYGDEDILARHGKTRNKDGQPYLVVGKARYKTVVVPPLITVRSTTLKLLKRFTAVGGTIVFAGEFPQYVDAMPSSKAVEFASSCIQAPARGNKLVKALAPSVRRVSIMDEVGREIRPALHCLREDRDNFYLFICNTSLDHFDKRNDDKPVRERKQAFSSVSVTVLADGRGQMLELDPDSGTVLEADASKTQAGWKIRTSLPRIGSRLFILPKKRSRRRFPQKKLHSVLRKHSLRPAAWQIQMSEANCMVLDRAAYRIETSRWKTPENILRVDAAVRDVMGITRRGGQMVQPWARTKTEHPRQLTISLRYAFDVKVLPSGDLHLGIERPDSFRILLNDTDISADTDCGWWCDKSLRKLQIPPSVLTLGKNELFLECSYSENHPGLEIVYLLGNFGTRVTGAQASITKSPLTLKLGDWAKQGLAFYGGSVNYIHTVRPVLKKGERLVLRIPDYRGAAIRVLVNGREAGLIAWDPELDLTSFVDGQPLILGIEVLGHRRNSHGPHHLVEKWPRWTGPGEYVSAGDKWTDNYQLVPCGLMKAPELLITKPE